MDPTGIGAWIASNLGWEAVKGCAWRFVPDALRRDDLIEITSPGSQHTLDRPEPLGGGISYAVHGRLKRLPPGHKIWLLREDVQSGCVWPQGFFPVHFDEQKGTWSGKVSGPGTSRSPVTIHAVVAPPTSQDFFKYYQKLGGLREQKYEPLSRIPAECKNVASVQVFLP